MGKTEIAIEQNAQEKIPQEKVIPIADPESGGGDGSSEIKKRPFVLERKTGGGRGNMPLMLVAIGVILVFGLGMIAFLSTKGTTNPKTATEAAKPNLGRYATPTGAPGDLVPGDKMKPSPAEATKGGSVDAADIERTKSAKISSTQPTMQQAQRGTNRLTRSQSSRNRIRALATRSGRLLPMAAITRATSRQRRKKRKRSASRHSSLRRISRELHREATPGWRKQA
jgi:hypothetical protein